MSACWSLPAVCRAYRRVMADFTGGHLTGSRFERVDLSGSEFRAVNLSGSRFRGVALSGAVLGGVELGNVDINGEIENVTVNGVDIGPLIDAELNKRYPDRVKMRPADPAGFREAWDTVRGLWGQTGARARRRAAGVAARAGRRRVVVHRDAAPPGVRHRRVDQAGGAWRPGAVGPAGPAVGRDAGHPRGAQGPRRSPLARDGPRAAPRPDVHRPRARRRPDQRVAERQHRTGRRTRLAAAPQLPGPRMPARRPQRGVGTPAVRRTGPGRPRSPPAGGRRWTILTGLSGSRRPRMLAASTSGLWRNCARAGR